MPKVAHSSLSQGLPTLYVPASHVQPQTMPLLENIDKDSSPTFPLATHVAKPMFRLENILSWSMTSMIHLHALITISSIVLFTSLQTILVLVSQLLSWNKANCSLSAFDKENSIEFLLDLLHYIYNYYHGYIPCLPQPSCY